MLSIAQISEITAASVDAALEGTTVIPVVEEEDSTPVERSPTVLPSLPSLKHGLGSSKELSSLNHSFPAVHAQKEEEMKVAAKEREQNVEEQQGESILQREEKISELSETKVETDDSISCFPPPSSMPRSLSRLDTPVPGAMILKKRSVDHNPAPFKNTPLNEERVGEMEALRIEEEDENQGEGDQGLEAILMGTPYGGKRGKEISAALEFSQTARDDEVFAH